MTHNTQEREIQTAGADAANSLVCKDRYASIHLTQPILAGEDSASASFSRSDRWMSGFFTDPHTS